MQRGAATVTGSFRRALTFALSRHAFEDEHFLLVRCQRAQGSQILPNGRISASLHTTH